MVIAFCGHSEIYDDGTLEARLFHLLENVVANESVEMLLGGYGDFDFLAYKCCKRLKEQGRRVLLIYVTPYLHFVMPHEKYDEIIYPDIEDKPPKYAIVYRNRWMIDKADCVISYVNYERGGAFTTYAYAKKKGKEVINLGEL